MQENAKYPQWRNKRDKGYKHTSKLSMIVQTNNGAGYKCDKRSTNVHYYEEMTSHALGEVAGSRKTLPHM